MNSYSSKKNRWCLWKAHWVKKFHSAGCKMYRYIQGCINRPPLLHFSLSNSLCKHWTLEKREEVAELQRVQCLCVCRCVYVRMFVYMRLRSRASFGYQWAAHYAVGISGTITEINETTGVENISNSLFPCLSCLFLSLSLFHSLTQTW